MQTLLHKIGAGIVGAAMFVGGLFGYHPDQQQLAGTFQTPDVRALFETTLASRITNTATSFTLTSATDFDGNTLASSTYGFIIDEGTASEEMVLADCTATACTNATRGLSARTGTTTVSALQKEHRRGASVKITDAPSVVFAVNAFKGRQNLENLLTYNSALTFSTSSNQLVSALWASSAANVASTTVDARVTVLDLLNAHLAGTETFTGAKTFSALATFSAGGLFNTVLPQSSVVPSTGNDLVNKTYADGLAIAGSPNAAEDAKGIVEIATKAEAALGTASGSTGAKLTLPASMATSTSQVATTSVVMTNTSGKIDSSFLTSQNYTLGNLTTGTIAATDITINGSMIATTSVQTFNASGTWTKPSVGTMALIEAWGAGGAGASRASSGVAGGGGGGSCSWRVMALSALSATETVTIGTGGSGVSGNTAGGAGSASTFGAHVTAWGGGGSFSSGTTAEASGGGGGGPLGPGGNGGSSSAGTAGSPGSPVAGSGATNSGGGGPGLVSGGGGAANAAGGNTMCGGGGGGGNGAAGGTSQNGGAGGSSGGNGTAPGGGGGGVSSGTSGAGAAGRIVVTVF